jgi:hypothetical protein
VKPNINIDPNTLWCLLLFSVRYAMGRMSAAPGEVADWVRLYRKHLSSTQADQIANEIEKELRDRESRGTLLGMKCDHEVWARLVADLRVPF